MDDNDVWSHMCFGGIKKYLTKTTLQCPACKMLKPLKGDG